MAKPEVTYPAIPVTKTLTATDGNVTVTTKLYGEVSPERLAKEEKEIKYRANQLNPVPQRKREQKPQDDFADRLDEFESFNSGGRRR